MKLLETPIAFNPQDNLDKTLAHVQTTARAYIAFIDFNKKELVHPTIGDKLSVTIILDETTTEANAISATHSTEATAEGQEALIDAELGDEEDVNVFDEDDVGQKGQKDMNPLTWSPTVIEPTEVTPTGHITLLLKRRRDPSFEGPRQLRPFVSHPLITANIRHASTTKALAKIIVNDLLPSNHSLHQYAV